MNMRGKPEKVLTNLKNIYGSNSYIDKLKELFTIIEPLAKEKGIEVQLDPTLGTKYKLYSGLTFSLVSISYIASNYNTNDNTSLIYSFI